MHALALVVLAWLIRRARPVTVAFAVYEAWRRMPPDQRRKLIESAQRNAPRIASTLARRKRLRP